MYTARTPLNCMLDTPQEGAQQAGREHPSKLCVTAINFMHKALCAAAFGFSGLETRSLGQLVTLCVLQGAMVLYLLAYRPYLEWHLMWLEIACHALEAALFGCAAGLYGERPCTVPTTPLVVLHGQAGTCAAAA